MCPWVRHCIAGMDSSSSSYRATETVWTLSHRHVILGCCSWGWDQAFRLIASENGERYYHLFSSGIIIYQPPHQGFERFLKRWMIVSIGIGMFGEKRSCPEILQTKTSEVHSHEHMNIYLVSQSLAKACLTCLHICACLARYLCMPIYRLTSVKCTSNKYSYGILTWIQV